jgi:hypothetical protein
VFGRKIVGSTVLWYPMANTQPGSKPKLGIVLEANDEGCCDLIVFEPAGGTNRVKASHHRDSKQLYSPGTTKLTGGALRDGCWELTEISKLVLAIGEQAAGDVEAVADSKESKADRMAKAREAKKAKAEAEKPEAEAVE